MIADLEKMTRMIESFSKEEHIQLLKIIVEKDSASVSENSNGTFVQMNELKEETIEQINKYIDYVLLKECEIKEVEDTKDRLKNNMEEWNGKEWNGKEWNKRRGLNGRTYFMEWLPLFHLTLWKVGLTWWTDLAVKSDHDFHPVFLLYFTNKSIT